MEEKWVEGDLQSLLPGQEIRRLGKGSAYYHHAIYIGNHHVIHFYDPDTTIDTRNTKIRDDKWDDFMDNHKEFEVNVGDYAFSFQEVVKRAQSQVGNPLIKYSLFSNNCENFTKWCISGESVSNQVEKGKKVGVSAAGAIGGAAVVKAATGIGVSSIAAGGARIIVSALAAPVVLETAAVVGIGYGIHKLIKKKKKTSKTPTPPLFPLTFSALSDKSQSTFLQQHDPYKQMRHSALTSKTV